MTFEQSLKEIEKFDKHIKILQENIDIIRGRRDLRIIQTFSFFNEEEIGHDLYQQASDRICG